VLPPAGVPGSTTQFTLFGRGLPGGQPAGITVDGKPLDKIAVSIALPGDIESTQPTDNLSANQAGLDAFTYV
jgi:hypothetical protein